MFYPIKNVNVDIFIMIIIEVEVDTIKNMIFVFNYIFPSLYYFRFEYFFKTIKCDIITHTAAIVVSQPFHVITVRMMAQFVGRETIYR